VGVVHSDAGDDAGDVYCIFGRGVLIAAIAPLKGPSERVLAVLFIRDIKSVFCRSNDFKIVFAVGAVVLKTIFRTF
jgi:hypothetical protein